MEAIPVPIYTLTRLSATASNDNWFEHNGPSATFTPPTWATAIHKLVNASLPESTSQYLIDSESDSDSSISLASDFEDDENPSSAPREDQQQQQQTEGEVTVKPQRARIWAIAHSPGAATTAILYSKHSTLIPDRVCRSRVIFDTPPLRGSRPSTPPPPQPDPVDPLPFTRGTLTSEAKVWEWMYSGGDPVAGFSSHPVPKLAAEFWRAIDSAECALCARPLELSGSDFICSAGHMFCKC